MASYVTKDCTRCGACIDQCPTSSIVDAEPIVLIDSDSCTNCEACIPVCPVDAIKKLKELK